MTNPAPPYRPPVLSHPRDGVFPEPTSGSPLLAQPRAIGALIAFDAGMNLLIARPAAYGLLPVVIVLLRLALLGLLLLAASAWGFDWWAWTTLGQSPFQLPEGTWTTFGLVVGALAVAEHAALHFLLVALPRSLRHQEWPLRSAFTWRALALTALVRLVTYLALGVGFSMFGVGTLLALPLVLSPYLVADKGLGVFAACARSSTLVLRHFGTALLFEFVSLGLLLCGLLLCGVGLIPAYVLVTAGRAALYEQLTDETTARR